MKNFIAGVGTAAAYIYFQMAAIAWMAGYDSLMQFVTNISF